MSEVNFMAVTWHLKLMQVKRDINNEELARLTGLHPGTIAKLRSDIPKQLTIRTLTKLCKALKCTPSDLLGWDSEDDAA